MHVEITRLITGWLEHAEFGVNVLAPLVPRLNLAGKSDKKPPKVTIYNDVDFDIASVHGVDPPVMPALVVVSDVDLRSGDTSEEKKSAINYSAVVGVGYYEEEGESKALVVRNGNYVLRAVMRSLRAYNWSAERSKDFRELNAIRIAKLTNVTVQRMAGAVPTDRLLGMVFADLLVMDKAP